MYADVWCPSGCCSCSCLVMFCIVFVIVNVAIAAVVVWLLRTAVQEETWYCCAGGFLRTALIWKLQYPAYNSLNLCRSWLEKIYIYIHIHVCVCVCVVTLNIHLPAYRVQWPAGKVPKSSSNSLLQPRDSTPGIGMHFSALYGHSEVGRASRSSCLSHVHNWNTTLRGAILSLETATQLSKIRNPLKFVNKTGVWNPARRLPWTWIG